MIDPILEQENIFVGCIEVVDLGIPGVAGPIGPQGAQGPAGVDGVQGADGPQGPQGAYGLVGPIGLTGPQGEVGPIGALGPKGDTGAIGPQGSIGLTGPQGPQGVKGDTGAKGDIGLTGPKGDQGNQGPQGIQGEQGERGLTGESGLDQMPISGNVTATEAMKNKVLIVTANTIFTIANTILSKDWAVRVIVKNGNFEPRKGTTRIWSGGNPDMSLEVGSDFAIRQEGITSNLLVSGKFVSNPFIAYFDTRNTISGGSGDKQVRLQFANSLVPILIDWMDGTQESYVQINTSANATHDYTDAGFKLIKLYGADFSFVSGNTNPERNKLCDVLNYGNSVFSNGSFDNCQNVRFDNTNGIPRFKNNLTACFKNTKLTKINNIELADWSVITRLNFMFNLSLFNQPLRAVNVSNVTDFTGFMSGKSPSDYSADNYDGILNGWSDRSFVPNKSHFFGSIKHTASATVAKALWTRPYLLAPITNAVNNGAGLMRVTAPLHGMSTGNKVFIRNVVGGMGINRAWNVTVIDVNTIDLIDSVYSTAYVGGGEIVTGWGLTVTDGGI